MSDSVNSLVGALYGRLLLRDLFGKIVPGWIVLSGVVLRLDMSTTGSLLAFDSGAVRLAIGAGLAWVTSFALQQLGEFTGYLRYWPDSLSDRRNRYDLRISFHRLASVDEQMQHERMVVIKEATGLASVALLISALLWLSTLARFSSLATAAPDARFFAVLAALLSSSLVLRASHVRHCARQFDFAERVIAAGAQAA